MSDKTFRHRVNDQLIGLGKCLEASGKIGGFAEHGPFLGGVLPHQFADDDMTRRDPDSCRNTKLWMGIVLIQRLHCIQNSQASMYRSFRIVFMGLGVPKIDHHPITHVFCDIAIEPSNGVATGV